MDRNLWYDWNNRDSMIQRETRIKNNKILSKISFTNKNDFNQVERIIYLIVKSHFLFTNLIQKHLEWNSYSL